MTVIESSNDFFLFCSRLLKGVPVKAKVTLSANASEFASRSRAAATAKGYSIGWSRFQQFCAERSEMCLPAEPIVVANFVAEMADVGLAVSTIEKSLAAISFEHRRRCLSTPSRNEGVRLVLEGVRRELAKPSRQVKPFTLDIIDRAVKALGSSSSFMVWRTVWRMTVGLFGMLRFSEITRIRVRDIFFSDSGDMRIFIPRSKTDQRSKGMTKWIPSLDKSFCPVKLTRVFMSRFKLRSGFMQPKSVCNSKKSIDYNVGRDNLRRVLALIDEPYEGYTEHSYKRGGALAALDAGLTTREQMLFGNWASERMVHLYSGQSQNVHHALIRRVAGIR